MKTGDSLWFQYPYSEQVATGDRGRTWSAGEGFNTHIASKLRRFEKLVNCSWTVFQYPYSEQVATRSLPELLTALRVFQYPYSEQVATRDFDIIVTKSKFQYPYSEQVATFYRRSFGGMRPGFNTHIASKLRLPMYTAFVLSLGFNTHIASKLRPIAAMSKGKKKKFQYPYSEQVATDECILARKEAEVSIPI